MRDAHRLVVQRRQRQAQRIRAIAERPLIELAEIDAIDNDENTVTVHLLSDPTQVFTVSSDLSGVVPTVGRRVRIDRNTEEPVLLPPLDGFMSIDGGLASSDFPGFLQGGPGWAISGDGLAEFWNIILRGILVPGTTELLAETTFESDISPWTGSGVTQSSTQAHTGSDSMRVNSGSIAVSERFTVEEGETYRYLGWVYDELTNPVLASGGGVGWYEDASDPDGSYLSISALTLRWRSQGAWHEIFSVTEAPEGAVQGQVRLGPAGAGDGGGGQIYWDDVSFRQANIIDSALLRDVSADHFQVTGQLDLPLRVSTSPALDAVTTPPSATGQSSETRTMRAGEQVLAHSNWTLGAGFTAGSGEYRIPLPVPTNQPSPVDLVLGHGLIFDTSASTRWPVTIERVSRTTARLFYTSPTASGFVTHNTPIPWASGDKIDLNWSYYGAGSG